MIVKANAKINLTLDIIDKREDAYHNIDTIMQTVSLCDEIHITKNNKGRIKLTCAKILLPNDDRNIAYKAAESIFKYAGIEKMGVDIHIIKEIPTQAGLGGGSADAAAVLKAINELFNLNISISELANIGSSLGADVPFCVLGGIKRCKGIGDVIEEVSSMPNCKLLLCKPEVGVDTKYAYEQCDKFPNTSKNSTKKMLEALSVGNLKEVAKSISNRFDEVLHIPEIEVIKAIMKEKGALNAIMTGSGSTVYGIFEESFDTVEIEKELKEIGKCYVCTTI